MGYLATGELPQRHGNAHPSIVPYQSFATHDGQLFLAIGNDSQFAQFCQLAQAKELALDSRFTTNSLRVENRKVLLPKIDRIIGQHGTHWWLENLASIGVPCSPVNDLAQVFEHPQIKHRKMVRTLADEDGNSIKTLSNPINMSHNPLEYRAPSPKLAQHTLSILTNDLGLSIDECRQLHQQGIVELIDELKGTS